jgi:hypothetical protein
MDVLIGKVTHYYNHLGVAVLDLAEPVQVGEVVYFRGRTSDFYQKVGSLEIEHHKLQSAGPGEVAMKVVKPVRTGDKLYKVASGEIPDEYQDVKEAGL